MKRNGNFLFINIFITSPKYINHYRKKRPQAFSVSPGTAHGSRQSSGHFPGRLYQSLKLKTQSSDHEQLYYFT
ncbi:hypothetical protein HMPREF3038_02119 [Akkermansia sp. KLE1797]|nr:hypothetical protein HMPREF3038_02119 [Akkermansia sp. KLE1797]KXU53547.1 hypothetical protein HMPREF3039_02269 [Akkermansia sp. KLE1798]KZA05741.1 hypothetical protein HMPREF1326_00567 [Akkermansia sp. KLE1605]